MMSDKRSTKHDIVASEQPSNPTAQDGLARAVHWCLLCGLIISALLMTVGIVISLARHEVAPESQPKPTLTLVREAASGSGVALLEVGLVLLMFTPVLRVVVLAIGWAAERETRMAAVAAIVLTLLAICVYLSFR